MQVVENFLSKEDIKPIIAKIFELKEYWTLRANYLEVIPFYSLGAAGYMDLSEHGQNAYKEKYQKTNPILKDNFSALYSKIFTKLEEIFSHKFELYENSAHPGFHVFLNDYVFEIALASRHCDLQYKYIDWQGIKIDPSKSISFTLYLELPKHGGGIYYWDLFYEDLKDLEYKEKEDEIHKHEKKLKLFKEGDLFIHNGHQYHQIAPFFDIEPEDQRISLQGHAIYAPELNKYLVHW
jgi:hypothetical protein